MKIVPFDTLPKQSFVANFARLPSVLRSCVARITFLLCAFFDVSW